MEVISLQSGSAGNCVFVRSGEMRLLFDAGLSGSKAESRLAEYGYDIRDCNALVLSHEHYDHISGVGVFHLSLRHRRDHMYIHVRDQVHELQQSGDDAAEMNEEEGG